MNIFWLKHFSYSHNNFNPALNFFFLFFPDLEICQVSNEQRK